MTYSAWGCTYNLLAYPCKVRPNFFLRPGGVHPLATPMDHKEGKMYVGREETEESLPNRYSAL